MRQKWVVANWKCYPQSIIKAKELFSAVKRRLKKIRKTTVVICPPFIFLPALTKVKGNLVLGAQDCFWEKEGAYTGAISPLMLKDLKVNYVIVGHSERRLYFKEDEEMINKKLQLALKLNLKTILCIGETFQQKKKGLTKRVLKEQLQKSLRGIPEQLKRKNLIVAYEPVWAIGSGKPCNFLEAKQINLFLKRRLKNTPLLYGGSVNSYNAPDYLAVAGFDGLLVGGASLDPLEFSQIVHHIDFL